MINLNKNTSRPHFVHSNINKTHLHEPVTFNANLISQMAKVFEKGESIEYAGKAVSYLAKGTK